MVRIIAVLFHVFQFVLVENGHIMFKIIALSFSSVMFSSSRYERCRYQRRLCVVAVQDLEEVGCAGDGRKGILTA